MEYHNRHRFRLSTEGRMLRKPYVYFKLFNCFNYYLVDGPHCWGFGLLQFGSRHLFFVGFCGVSILYIGRTT